ALRINSAMAFNHHASQSEQHSAVRLLGVKLVAQLFECPSRQQVAELGQQGARERRSQELVDLPRGALGCLQRDVAAEAFRDNYVCGSLAYAVTLDEADILQLRQVHPAEQFRRLADLLVALYLLNTDVEQADGGPLEVEQDARHGAAHHRER